MILAGDVGGTKTHLALYEPGAPARRPVMDRKFFSQEAPSLTDIVKRFLDDAPGRPQRAAFGIAGPVVENLSETTNLPWDVDGEAMGEALGGVDVTLMNDLVATAHGLQVLVDGDLDVLARGKDVKGNRALIAAGTGLGEAFLAYDGNGWLPSASEGGHADFAPRDPLEDELHLWLRAKYGRVSFERILSGPGLADLYRFMSDTGRGREPEDVAKRFARAKDPAVVVTETAMDGSCERSRLTIERFIEIYGSEAGNLALKALAVGGVYVGGGIAPRMRSFFGKDRFVKAFRDKGRLRPLMESIRVSIVLDAQTALWGAATVALATPTKEPA